MFMNKKIVYSLIFILVGIIAAIFIYRKSTANSQASDSATPAHHELVTAQAHILLGINLVDPEEAPPPIKDSVLRGYSIIMNTPFYAPNYAKDQLSCTHCHFFGGDTLGGRNNGISLVGVTHVYPRYSEREGKTISLAQRINSCFERSLSGKPLPEGSQEMADILNYLKWISHDIKNFQIFPWLGLSLIKSNRKPNTANGERLYDIYCAMCHKSDGQGGAELTPVEGKIYPPLWGPNSFNDGAGMSKLTTLASFIFWNMPYKNSVLTEEQSIDVASFILQQPRPHFE